MIQVRVEGQILPASPGEARLRLSTTRPIVAATLASEGPIDSNETYLGLTTADAKEALKMKVDLDEAKQQARAHGSEEIASYQEEKEKSETVLKLKNEAMGQMEAALDQKNKALERKNEALGVCRAYHRVRTQAAV